MIDTLTGDPLVAPSFLTGSVGSESLLSQNDLQPVVQQAITYWQSAGVDSGSLDRLNSIPVHVADLPGPFLGFASDNGIRIDRDAAGYGWNMDAGRISHGSLDLLTAVTHEFGHALGMEHDHDDHVMNAQLSPRANSSPSIAVSRFDRLADVSDLPTEHGPLTDRADLTCDLALKAVTDQPLLTDNDRDASRSMTRRSRLLRRARIAQERAEGESTVVDHQTERHEFFALYGSSADM